MTPQPSPEPYEPGDKVRIYLGESDPDVEYHGTDCIVVERLADNLSRETGRELDQYSYQVKREDSDERLPVTFRHRDLVPGKS
jgi:hypothetical protein